MRIVDLVIALGWVLFWTGWLAAAFHVDAGRSGWGRHAGVRLLVVVVVVALLRVRSFRGHHVGDPVWWGIGLGLFTVGLALAVWARMHLGRNWGTPMSEKDDPHLVTTGPYRWIRNPIYTGLILAMVGTAVAVSLDWLAVAIVAGGYFVYSAFVEQRYMSERFPETYPAYRRTTKMLIPFVF